ncbi:MAG: amidohydrolase family protein [bacterium]|nr:amidohydrolase family protein [bacterium]
MRSCFKSKYTTPLILEQHIHGAFGVNFNTAGKDDVKYACQELFKHGIGIVFPTLVTDSVENIKRQTEIIKDAAKELEKNSAKILGIHLEGIFINPEKRGIHNPEHFLPLTVDNYKKIEDDFIKIVTLAPELDQGLIDYLKSKGVKVQAGHCLGHNLEKIDGTTHTFNAMGAISHKNPSTASSALINNNLYSEIIADGIHVNDDTLKLFFKCKPEDKVILVSDALPITKSDIKETTFADHKIFYDGEKATSQDGVLAGSTTLLDEVIKILNAKQMFSKKFIENPYKYHGLRPLGKITWDKDWNILNIKA